MVLFFFGQNEYLIARKVRELKRKYVEKAGGDFNLVCLDGETLKFEDFTRQIQAMPLLATSRLIIIEKILKNKDKKVLEVVKEYLEKISSSTVLLFVEYGNPDKRLALFKALNRPKIAQHFEAIEPYKMPRFVTDEVLSRGGKINQDAASLLSLSVGDDLWRMSNEIEKLVSYCEGEITVKDVEELVEKNVSSNIFAMIEELSRSNKKSAFTNLQALLEVGEPPLRILSLINYQFRTIAQVKEALETTNNQFMMAKTARLSQFQVSKAVGLASKFTYSRLAYIYGVMSRVDEQIKTGKIEGSEGLRDLVLAL